MARGERYRAAYLLSGGSGRRPGYGGYWVEWYIRDTRGILRRRRAKFPSRDEARLFCRRKTDELNAPLLGHFHWSHMIRTFGDACANLSASTQAEYMATLAALAKFIGHPPQAHEITAPVCQRFISNESTRASRRGKGRLSPESVHKAYRQLAAFINYGVSQDPPWWIRSPLAAVKLPRRPEQFVRAPADQDVSTILLACSNSPDPPGWYIAIRLAFETALRREDVVDLKWGNLSRQRDPDGPGTVLVIDTMTAKRGKRGLWCVTQELDRAIERQRIRIGTKSPTVLGWMKFDDRAWASLRLSAGGAGWKFHDLRRAAASHAQLLEEGIARAARLLDHSSTTVTKRHYLDRLRWARRYARALESANLPTLEAVIGTPTNAAPPASTPVGSAQVSG